MSRRNTRARKIAVWLTNGEVECWNFAVRHARRVREALPRASLQVCGDASEFCEILSDAAIALVWTFEEAWLTGAPGLEWIVTPAAGKDYLTVTERPGLDIEYCSFHGELMGGTVLAMMLAHGRGIIPAHRLQQARTWGRRELAPRLKPLRGSRLTILGFGNIGRWIGRLAKPFGVRLTGIKQSPAPRPDYFDEQDRLALPDELDRMLAESDYLVVSLPRTDETDHILDGRRLGLLPSHSVVINVGRGNAIDERALADRLDAGAIEAAYLDVYEQEPLPEASPLWGCPRAFVMPHASAISPNYLDLFVEEFIWKYRRRYET